MKKIREMVILLLALITEGKVHREHFMLQLQIRQDRGLILYGLVQLRPKTYRLR